MSVCGVTALALVCSGRLAVAAVAAEPATTSIQLETEKVIVFKDGYCLIIKRGTAVTDKNGEIHTDQVPDAAVLGSFWAVPSEGKLVSMRAGWNKAVTKVDKEVPCTQTLEVLQANLGKSCKIELVDKTVLAGIIQQVLVRETSAAFSNNLPESPSVLSSIAHPVPRHASARSVSIPDPSVESRTISGIAGTHFVLRTETGDVMLPISQVRSLTIHQMKTTAARTVTTTTRSKQLTFRFAEPGKRRELLVMYFRPGLRWIPTYRICLQDQAKKKRATVSLQAEIINEAEDLKDVPLDIVVGVPNFRFRNLPSPLVLEKTLRNALNQAAPQLMGQFRNDLSNALFTQRSGEIRRNVRPAPAAEGGPEVQLPAELTAAGTQDLFVYHLPKLDLDKGERIAVAISSTEVPYRDVYTWDLHMKRKDIETAPSGAGVRSPLVLSKNEVWHQIELTNTSDVPWTTGAAMIMQGNQPLAQELLTYTSPKSAVRVPVTVSVDTRGSFHETEVSRQPKHLLWDRYHYAKINKEAALDLRNNKSEPISAEITVRFGGKVDHATDDGHVTTDAFNSADWDKYRGSPAVNNSSTVRWNVTIEPGKSFTPGVKYHYFIRH